MEELQEALDNPEEFFERLARAAGPVAKRMLIAKLKPAIWPVAKKMGLLWTDVIALLELVDTTAELQEAMEGPEAFLEKMAGALGPAAHRLILAKLRPVMETFLHPQQLTWQDVRLTIRIEHMTSMTSDVFDTSMAVKYSI